MTQVWLSIFQCSWSEEPWACTEIVCSARWHRRNQNTLQLVVYKVATCCIQTAPLFPSPSVHLNMSCRIHIAYSPSLYLSDILYYPRLLKFAWMECSGGKVYLEQPGESGLRVDCKNKRSACSVSGLRDQSQRWPSETLIWSGVHARSSEWRKNQRTRSSKSNSLDLQELYVEVVQSISAMHLIDGKGWDYVQFSLRWSALHSDGERAMSKRSVWIAREPVGGDKDKKRPTP